MNRRQHLRQIARQSLTAGSPGQPPLRPLAALCATLPTWAETAGSRLCLDLGQDSGLLSEDRKWGSAIAAVIATGNPELIQAVLRDAEGRITHQTRDLARRVTVATLLAGRPALNPAAGRDRQSDTLSGNSAGIVEPATIPAQDHDGTTVALYALAAAAAWAGQVDLQPRIDAAQGVGVPNEAISAVLGIAHALAIIATLLNGGPRRNAAQSLRRACVPVEKPDPRPTDSARFPKGP
ncbi:hypothetical protein [Paenirhodobacter sp.]|uniref:hypothetical protein n=1 Tax=Paenirhodobacter sp. TaxID=1965326 RepID=UPI003B3DE704